MPADPVLSHFTSAAIAMLGRFTIELGQRDPAMLAAVEEALRAGERQSVAIVAGDGEIRVVWEVISVYGTRRVVASITESSDAPCTPSTPPSSTH